jgi:hypothetical protein
MQPRGILLTLAGVAALAAVLAPGAVAAGSATGLRPSVSPPQRLAIDIRAVGGAGHGEHLTLTNFAVQPGLPVHVTFTNYTRGFHTFTIPELGVTALIPPAQGTTPAKTTVTFTPHAYGVFGWHCLLCPDSTHANATAMHGRVYAIMGV